MMKQQLVAAIKLRVHQRNNVIDNILNQYNTSIIDDDCKYQDNLLDFSDELLKTADSDENAIFLPEEVTDEVEDKTANLF